MKLMMFKFVKFNSADDKMRIHDEGIENPGYSVPSNEFSKY